MLVGLSQTVLHAVAGTQPCEGAAAIAPPLLTRMKKRRLSEPGLPRYVEMTSPKVHLFVRSDALRACRRSSHAAPRCRVSSMVPVKVHEDPHTEP